MRHGQPEYRSGAARRGSEVLAVDASASAIERIQKTAAAEHLAIDAELVDIGNYEITGRFDTIVAIVNVLTEGTTFMGMFEPGNYYLFGQNELEDSFRGWNILHSIRDSFDAPGNTRKEFSTVIARKT